MSCNAIVFSDVIYCRLEASRVVSDASCAIVKASDSVDLGRERCLAQGRLAQ